MCLMHVLAVMGGMECGSFSLEELSVIYLHTEVCSVTF